MTAISAKELSDMRTVADDYFPDTCTIQTKTEGIGSSGSYTETWANTYTSVACRVDYIPMGEENRSADTVSADSIAMLNIPYDQAISREDRVVHNSITWNVTEVIDNQSYRTIRRARLQRIDNA